MTKVKICGITNLEDALAAAEYGADMLGFNFYRRSERYITPKAARGIIRHLPPEILTIGVFVNESAETVADVSATLGLGAVQLHGDETPEFVAEIQAKCGVPVIKAFRVKEKFDAETAAGYNADLILLDAFRHGAYGGTGTTFDWETARNFAGKLILAGGLTPENVAEAVRIAAPYAVDVAGGVESSPGRKDHTKLKAFIENAKRA